jgi:hypothetical protein
MRVETEGPRLCVKTAGLVMQAAPSADCLLSVAQPDGSLERRVALVATDKDGLAASIRIDGAREEATGLLRRTIVLQGAIEFRGRTLDVIVRMHIFASSPAVRLEVTIRNPSRALHHSGFWELGDAGSILFRDVSLRVQHAGAVRFVCYPEPESAPWIAASALTIYQDSSGGPNWQSRVHVNREGRVPHRFRGYRVERDGTSSDGLRANPVVVVEHAGGLTAACVRHFWQNFPKAIEADGAGLTVRLFPGQFGDVHELQGGEQKTHVIGLSFGPDSVGDVPLSWILEPSVLTAVPEWYATSRAMPWLTPSAASREEGYETLVSAAIEGPDTFEEKRERIDEYGWRHFGDIYADHESIGHSGEHPLVSHYNNQYDALAGLAIQLMRSGDLRWWAAMEELAAHVVDIDLYHTTEDKAAYNGGLFWHTAHYTDAGKSTHRTYPRGPRAPSGGPSNEHNYSTGLLLHYLLTGSPASRESVRQLAEWVLAMDDGGRTVFRWLTRTATGLASSTASTTYHGPGRGAGNSIAALLNAHRLTGDRRYLQKAEALVRRCIHPSDSLDSLDLLDAERRWSYTVFLQVLGRYLEDKIIRGELDACYAYAQASLLHYARWMAVNEYPYLERPEKLEYPTETWTAQDIRKAEVLALAAKHASVDERARLLDRAEFFFRNSIDSMLKSATRSLTRPVVILLSNGYSFPVLSTKAPTKPAAGPRTTDFDRPEHFTPQRVLARRHAALVACLAFVVSAIALVWVIGR